MKRASEKAVHSGLLDNCTRAVLCCSPFLAFKIFWNGIVVTQLVTSVDMEWPSSDSSTSLTEYFNLQTTVTFFNMNIFQCILREFTSSADLNMPATFISAFAWALAIPLMCLIAYIGLTIYNCFGEYQSVGDSERLAECLEQLRDDWGTFDHPQVGSATLRRHLR